MEEETDADKNRFLICLMQVSQRIKKKNWEICTPVDIAETLKAIRN